MDDAAIIPVELAGEPRPVLKARLTVAGQVSLQRLKAGSVGVSVRFSRWLGTDEQPWDREILVTEEWQPLNLGWLSGGASFLVLTNTRAAHQVIPSAEEQSANEARVVEVGLMLVPATKEKSGPLNMWDEAPTADSPTPVACWLVPPGESLPATPADVRLLYLRCRQGEARVRLWLAPK